MSMMFWEATVEKVEKVDGSVFYANKLTKGRMNLMKLKCRILIVALIACLVPALAAPLAYSQESFLPARVKDISDRAYESAVIELLDGAKKSIVMSMYSISLGTKGNNPVKLLLNDLLEARDRGVSVTLYLNTLFRKSSRTDTRIIDTPTMKKLQDAGCIIHLIEYHQRLHDKLIIVDERYVVEASTNWSISALRNNYESATLIDSRDLARIKLARVKSFILPEKPPLKKPDKELYIKNMPEEISIPQAFVTDKRYLPRMVRRQSIYSTQLYLMLLAYSQSIDKRDFFLDMGAMGLSMGMSESYRNSTLRQRVMRNLRDLEKRYSLINVKFFHNKDAWIELRDISGDTFAIPSTIILDQESPLRVKFYLIVQELLKSQGEDINAMSGREIEKRFHVYHTTIYKARKEVEKKEE